MRKLVEITPVPLEHCMGGEGTVMMERLLNALAEIPIVSHVRGISLLL